MHNADEAYMPHITGLFMLTAFFMLPSIDSLHASDSSTYNLDNALWSHLVIILYLALTSIFILVRLRRCGRDSSTKSRAGNEPWLNRALMIVLALLQAIFVTLNQTAHVLNWPAWIDAFSFALPDYLRTAFAISTLCGLVLLFWAHLTLGRYYSIKLELSDRHMLIRSGPYAYIRHPMYSAMILFFVSSSLVTANLLPVLSSIGLALCMVVRIPREERMLQNFFGVEYIDYCKTTGALFPVRWN